MQSFGVGKTGVGKMGVGEMGQIIGEMGVGEMETNRSKVSKRSKWD